MPSFPDAAFLDPALFLRCAETTLAKAVPAANEVRYPHISSTTRRGLDHESKMGGRSTGPELAMRNSKAVSSRAEFSAEPSLGKAQIVSNDVDGLAEYFGSFLRRHSSEVSHLN